MAFDQHVLRYGRPSKPSAVSYSTDVIVAHDEGPLRTRPAGTSFPSVGSRTVTDHVGIVEANLGNGWLQTIGIPLRLTLDRGELPEMCPTAAKATLRHRLRASTPEWSDESRRSVFRRNELGERCLVGTCDYVRPTRLLDTPARGVISTRMMMPKKYVTRAGTGWEFEEDHDGSQAIQALQEKLGVEGYDGLIGPETICSAAAPQDSWARP